MVIHFCFTQRRFLPEKVEFRPAEAVGMP